MYVEVCKKHNLECGQLTVEAKIGGVNYTYCCQQGMNKTLEEFTQFMGSNK